MRSDTRRKQSNRFRRGSAPDPAGGAYDAPPGPLVGWGREYQSMDNCTFLFLFHSFPSARSGERIEETQLAGYRWISAGQRREGSVICCDPRTRIGAELFVYLHTLVMGKSLLRLGVKSRFQHIQFVLLYEVRCKRLQFNLSLDDRKYPQFPL